MDRALTVERTGTAKYLQLSNQLKKDIDNGIYPDGSRFPTCRELTSILGVSYLTVNNVLRELEKAGYVRREHGKGIFVNRLRHPKTAANATTNVGYFVDVNVSFFNRFFSTILRECQGKNVYNIPLHMLPGTVKVSPEEHEQWLQDIFRNYYDSIVIFGDRHFPYKTLDKYRDEIGQLNFVFLDDSELAFPNANRILVDSERIGYLAAEHFLKQGHRKLLVLTLQKLEEIYRRKLGIADNDHGRQIINGIERAYADSGVDFYREVTIVEDNHDSRVEDMLSGAMRSGVTAFFAVGDARAQEIYKCAGETGLQVGRDIAVLGLYNTPICTILNPELSTISVNEEEIGRTLARAVKEKWRGRVEKIEPKLIIRKSSQ